MSEAIPQQELSQEKIETGSLDHRATEISNFLKNKADGLMNQVDAIKNNIQNHFKKEEPKKETDEDYTERMKRQSRELNEAAALEDLKKQSALNQQSEDSNQNKNPTVGGVFMQDPVTLEKLNSNKRIDDTLKKYGV